MDRGAALRAESLPAVSRPAGAPPAEAAPVLAAPKAAAIAKTGAPESKGPVRDSGESKRYSDEGFVLLRSMRLEAAERAFNRAIDADSNSARAMQGMAEVCFERSRYEDALQYARFAAKLAPRSAAAHKLLGDTNFKLLRFREALEAYKIAKTLAPTDQVIADRLAQTLSRTK